MAAFFSAAQNAPAMVAAAPQALQLIKGLTGSNQPPPSRSTGNPFQSQRQGRGGQGGGRYNEVSGKGADMQYTGEGQGDYEAVNYRYVGKGAGEFKPLTKLKKRKEVSPLSLCCYMVTAFFSFVVLGIVLYLLFKIYFFPEPMFNCHTKEVWTATKVHWCCDNRNIGCAGGISVGQPVVTQDLPWNCKSGFDNWETGWCDAKKSWCCHNEGRGCDPVPGQFDCGSQELWNIGKKEYCCQHESKGCAPEDQTIDCNAGLNTWQTGWADFKKEYCCEHEGKGCEHQGIGLRVAFNCLSKETWSDDKASYCCTSQGVGCSATPAPFACEQGLDNWQMQWSPQKKAWCCKNKGRGCQQYDCMAQQSWSQDTAAWCCAHKSIGCQATTSAPYDCDAGFSNWQNGWSVSKKSYCCQTAAKACPETTAPLEAYDCNAGFQNWQSGWSIVKKDWCCANTGKACSAATTSAPFDCMAGYANWDAGWSVSKKVWCCQHQKLGCPNG